MYRIAKHFDYFDHRIDVEAMEAEGVSVRGLIEVSAVYAVPDGDISAYLGCDKLSKAT